MLAEIYLLKLEAAVRAAKEAAIEPQRPDCVAGHVGLELRNVDANYPLERSHRFAGIQPNSGLGDYSRLSCDGGRRSSGPSARISAGCLRWQELPRFSADAEMIRRRPIQQYHCSLAFSRARINAVIVEHWKEISDAIAPSLEARTKVAARPSRLKSKAGPAERHPGVLWKPQRFVQVRIVKNVPEMIDDLAISPKLIRKHKLDRPQHECEKCVVAVQQHGFYRRRTDEIA
jgi:hypothetical protein